MARLRLGDEPKALEAITNARMLHLRAPDGAVYEWVAAQRWGECPAPRRDEARRNLVEALALQPDVVFDTLVDCQDLVSNSAKAPLHKVLQEAKANSPLVTPLLGAALCVEQPTRVALQDARAVLLERTACGQGDLARWQGYLAIIAHALGEKEAFQRLHAAYSALPRRPESLDTVLAQLAAKK